MKRVLTLLFAAILLSSTTVCSGRTIIDETQDTGVPETVPVETGPLLEKDNLPERDFGGAKYTMSIADSSHMWDKTFHVMEELTGEGLNDARYYNIKNTEERFNVVIDELDCGDVWAAPFQAEILSGGTSLQVGYYADFCTLPLVKKGLMQELHTIPNIDLSRVYWNQKFQEVASVNGKLFFTIGAFETSYIERAHCIIFNKDLAEQYQLENLYEAVDNGKWTIDYFAQTMENVQTDLNGDGIYDVEDRWGYLSGSKQVLPNFWISGGKQTIKKDDQDIPYYALEGDEVFIDLIDKMFRIMWDDNNWYVEFANEDISNNALAMFAENKGLYMDMNFYSIQSFRDIDVDFGILPYPKADETQAEYLTRIEAAYKGVCVPVTNTGDTLDMTGTILEALYCDAQNNIIPAFIDVMLKGKNTRDEESAGMMDLILQNMIFDFGDTWWAFIRDQMFGPMFLNNNRSYGSEFAKIKTQAENSIREILPVFGVEEGTSAE